MGDTTVQSCAIFIASFATAEALMPPEIVRIAARESPDFGFTFYEILLECLGRNRGAVEIALYLIT